MNEPVADAVRGILDGHIVLSPPPGRAGPLPGRGPAPDPSAGPCPTSSTPEHQHAAIRFRDLLATYRSAEDLINIGAYADGSNPKIDEARARINDLRAFLRQTPTEPAPLG